MKHDYQTNQYAPATSHPSLRTCIAWGTACFLVWMAVGYIAIVQLTGGF